FRATLGQAVKAEEPLFEVHDPSGADLRLVVPEAQLPLIKVGQRARVRLAAGPSAIGHALVKRTAPAVTGIDRTAPVWAELRFSLTLGQIMPVSLRDGMLVRVSVVVGKSPPVLAVPTEALWREGSRAYVFVRKSDGAFERPEVQTGRAD